MDTPTSMSLAQQFMSFLQWYNVIWVAVWLIIAAKVNELVSSLIEDLITPLVLSPLFKKLHIDKLEDMSWNWVLYGKVIAKLISFVIIALLIFSLVKNLWLPTK